MAGGVTLAVAAVGLLAPHIPRLQAFVVQSAPDLAALFAVGILAAGIVRAGGARRSWPWTALGIAALAVSVSDHLTVSRAALGSPGCRRRAGADRLEVSAESGA